MTGGRSEAARPRPTYPEVGATTGAAPPAGYRVLSARHRLGPGTAADLARLGADLLAWRVHAAAGVRVVADAPVAAPGVLAQARLGVGPLHVPAPCVVVRTLHDERRVGFAYGTLPGHAFVGEEAFVVERVGRAGTDDGDDGTLFLVVRAFSRPGRWWVRPVAGVAPVAQRAYVALLARGARRLLGAGRGG